MYYLNNLSKTNVKYLKKELIMKNLSSTGNHIGTFGIP